MFGFPVVPVKYRSLHNNESLCQSSQRGAKIKRKSSSFINHSAIEITNAITFPKEGEKEKDESFFVCLVQLLDSPIKK